MAVEEGLGVPQALWRDEGVAPPTQHERATAEAACPVAVPADQVQQVAQSRYAAARAFMARLTSTAMISSESSACTIIRTFARWLRNAVSVGLKAVLVLKARKR